MSKTGFAMFLAGATAVSYTHLDVYKRQVLTRALSLFFL